MTEESAPKPESAKGAVDEPASGEKPHRDAETEAGGEVSSPQEATEDGGPGENVEGGAPPRERPGEDPVPVEDPGSDGMGLLPGFSLAATLRFAAHAAFCFAGRIADMVISLYNRVFRLEREYIADFDKSTGILHAKRGQWKRAAVHLEEALAVNPGDLETRMHLAEALCALNRFENAHHQFEKILDAKPDSSRALRALGFMFSRAQEYERAIDVLEKAVKLDPDHAPTLYRLGAAYDNCKRYDRAVDSFGEAIRQDPRFAKAYQAMGFTYESMGNRESAVDCFKKALELE
ncbi:MAG: tetratricopeptide repeat protein [Planctomycetota bacterium]|jgi:tetratricopeptide (TPR) repeat protein